jgi:hypothetical protein
VGNFFGSRPLQRLRLPADALAEHVESSRSHMAGSLEVTLSLSVLLSSSVSPSWVQRSPFTLRSDRTRERLLESVDSQIVGRGVFPYRSPHPAARRERGPLAELRLLQSLTTSRRPQLCCSFAVPLMRFFPLQHIQERQVHMAQACLTWSGSASRVSHPLDGFLPVRPATCISRWKRSWGCPLQSLFLAAKP